LSATELLALATTGADPAVIGEAVQRFREPAHVVAMPDGRLAVGLGDQFTRERSSHRWSWHATLPPIYPEWLGDRGFCELHGTRFPYAVGEMANGIATPAMVIAAARAGAIGFFGAAGLAPARVEAAIVELERTLGGSLPWGSSLIHSPQEPGIENAVADLYVRRGVPCVSASAYMSLTAAVVHCAYAGVSVDRHGCIQRPRRVLAKVSRPEVAARFIEPAPPELVDQLLAQGLLSADEARLAARLPVAEDITVESDSGGHTDNRPLSVVLPTIARLRDEICARRGYEREIRVGAAGGLGTPAALAAAFASGAAYVLTGSINQACVESGLHAEGRAMLAQAGIADVMMAPAADMFELGVDVQVLARGTMFGVRARRLRALYLQHESLEQLAPQDREWLERDILRAPLEEAWEAVEAFWAPRDPRQIERAATDPRHRMALLLRAYLGQASGWAIAGTPERRSDYQIWCGPAMGAFNAWAQGSFLADPAQRTVAQVAANLLEGAASITRAQQLRSLGVHVSANCFDFRPRVLATGPLTR
jgi:PfaD family protein